ncbi:MAG: type VI secretion protein ImpB [Planctomycetota bacterium]
MLNWLFVDMDSFFASIEQHLRPELRGRPVGIVPTDSEGTCVIAASQEAKRAGVSVGTRVHEARRLCGDIAFVQARPPTYVDVHREVMACIDRCAPVHKAYSIDEWSVRLVGAERSAAAARALGEHIRSEIRAGFSEAITCSVGIAPSRLLAKIASDLDKPDGLAVLAIEDMPDRLGHLELDDLTGIARSMAARLRAGGVSTVRDLWNLDRREAIGLWGSAIGGDWWAGFHGLDEPEIPTRRSSMSHANVLEPRLRDPRGARTMLVRLVSRLGRRLRNDGYLAGELGIGVRLDGGERWHASATLPHVQDTPELLNCFYGLWERQTWRGTRPLQVHAAVGGLVRADGQPGMLFGLERAPAELSRVLDAATDRWGPASLYFGSMHGCSHQMDDKIAFGRIPPSMATPDRAVGPKTGATHAR